ncbi:MAG: hypothetical protein IKS93_02815 [Methanobrevibacter sp.]|nr:hypothetical protein [Methanobrevibacter sp.]
MSTKVSYSNKNLKLTLDDRNYRIEVEAVADYWYQPCVMYFADGTGQPEDEDWEIQDVQSTWYELDEHGNEIQITPDEDMLEDLEDWLYENAEWEFPEDPYDDYEPDYEDDEEE